MSLLAVKLT